MLAGLAGTPTRIYYLYIFLNWSIFFYLLGYGFFAVNGLAVRLDNQEADRWSSWTYWRFAISIFITWMPAWFLHQLIYHNLVRWYYTAYYVVALVVGLWLGFFLATLIIDVTNCINVSFCVDEDFPPTHDGPDASWYIAFFGTIFFLIFIVVWFLIVIYIRNRMFYRATLDFYANSNRSPMGAAGMFGTVSYSGAAIGDHTETPYSKGDVGSSYMNLQVATERTMYTQPVGEMYSVPAMPSIAGTGYSLMQHLKVMPTFRKAE